jgi:pSer/pThr/pTyr-binding forkhead associated (FHA) protein
MTIGRDSSCDIAIDDANVSRKHAQLTQDVVGTWKLSDLNSTNGTLLNHAPVTTALLRDGDQITIGVTVLEFRESR